MNSTEKRIIKKYPNRRLYDTATSCYITLEDVKQLVLGYADIMIIDAKTQEELTRSVLLQIILEEESGGVPMFSCEVLSQIIRFYGHAMQGMMGNYLEQNMKLFHQMQQRLQEQARTVYGEQAIQPLPNQASSVWGEFMKFQAPAMQSVMTSYLEQSTHLFVEMQHQMQDRTRHLFGSFGFSPYGTPPHVALLEEEGRDTEQKTQKE